MSTQAISHENQMSFADLGIIESAPLRATKKAKQVKPTNNNAAVKALKSLLAEAENIGITLQEKYEANLEAHRIQSRVGISVDIEDVESLLVAISNANLALSNAN
tara:strand:+ start:16645 stop:16959 length:315 start_codon:yes stop_codon:yes gene_type:complete